MTAEILSTISLISYIVAGVSFALAVIFWFVFKIPSVVDYFTGRTARKNVEKRRQANARSGNKSYRPSATNADRGKITQTIPRTPAQKKEDVPRKAPAKDPNFRPETGLLADNRADSYEGQQTELLEGGGETELLTDDNAAAAINTEPAPAKRPGGKKLTMLNEVMLIHTDEVISW